MLLCLSGILVGFVGIYSEAKEATRQVALNVDRVSLSCSFLEKVKEKAKPLGEDSEEALSRRVGQKAGAIDATHFVVTEYSKQPQVTYVIAELYNCSDEFGLPLTELREKCKAGSGGACIELGWLQGQSLQPDESEEAINALTLACHLKREGACEGLEQHFYFLQFSKRLKKLETDCNRGTDANSCFSLAQLWSVAGKHDKALAYAQVACDKSKQTLCRLHSRLKKEGDPESASETWESTQKRLLAIEAVGRSIEDAPKGLSAIMEATKKKCSGRLENGLLKVACL